MIRGKMRPKRRYHNTMINPLSVTEMTPAYPCATWLSPNRKADKNTPTPNQTFDEEIFIQRVMKNTRVSSSEPATKITAGPRNNAANQGLSANVFTKAAIPLSTSEARWKKLAITGSRKNCTDKVNTTNTMPPSNKSQMFNAPASAHHAYATTTKSDAPRIKGLCPI